MADFYKAKTNTKGIATKRHFIPTAIARYKFYNRLSRSSDTTTDEKRDAGWVLAFLGHVSGTELATAEQMAPKRSSVLIATLEYNIEDWA